MNAEQKSAWFGLAVIAVTTILYLALVPFFGPVAASGAFGLLGFAGLIPLFFRGKSGVVTADERDQAIARKASLAGGMCSYVFFVLGCMAVWFVQMLRGEELITIYALPFIVVGGGVMLLLVRSVAILSLYRKGDAGYAG